MAMPRSLLEISVQFLYENFERYDKAVLNRILPPFEPIRSMLLANFREASNLEGVNRLWAALPLLLRSAECKEISTHLFRGKNHDCAPTNSLFQEFIRCLPSDTPNLECLSISIPSRGIDNIIIGRGAALSITNLKHLAELKLYDSPPILMSGFLEILQHCKNLKKIVADKIHLDVEPSSQLISETFNWQQIYYFNDTLRWELRKAEKEHCPSRNSVHFEILPSKLTELHLLKNLTHITKITIDADGMVNEAALFKLPFYPRLESAFLKCKIDKIKSAKAMIRLLERNGQTLRELQLMMLPPGQMAALQLVEWCPNLEKLFLINSSFTGSDVSVENLHRLHYATYENQYGYEQDLPTANFLFNPSTWRISYEDSDTRYKAWRRTYYQLR